MMEVFHLDDLGRSLGVLPRQPRHRVQHLADQDRVPLLQVGPGKKQIFKSFVFTFLNVCVDFWLRCARAENPGDVFFSKILHMGAIWVFKIFTTGFLLFFLINKLYASYFALLLGL